jgi:MYXO-CTERM domain-containing protein
VSVLVEVRTSANAVAFTQTVTANAQGWSATSTALVSGAYTVRVIATDAAGNASQPVTSAFTVDTSAPALAITAPANNSATTDTTPALTGTADPNAIISLTVRDATNMTVFQTTATANGAGAWSATSTALVEGAYTLSAATTNLAGTSSSAQVSFSLDLSVQLTIATPGAGALLTDATPTIAGTVEVGAQVIVTLLDAAGAAAFTVTLSPDQFNIWTTSPGAPLADGVYTARVRATDALGNMASIPDFTFTIDTTPPAVAITAPAVGAVVGAGPSLEGTAEAGAQVAVTVETFAGVVILSESVTASMTGVWTTSGAAVVAAGDYIITAVAQDPAGNTSMAQHGFTVDLTAAAVAIIAPANGSVVTTSQPTISGTVSSDGTLLVELLNAAGAVVESAMVLPGLVGDWSYQATTMLPDGMYTARATATRPNNTTAVATAAFTIDTIAPAIVVITAPADDALLNMQPITVTGTAEPGDMITISVGAQQVGVATADVNGAWTFELPAQADGLIAITAASPTSSADVSVTLDTAAPAVAITAPADGAIVPDGRPTVTGTGEAGALVIITVDGVEAERVTVGPDGMWAWTPADALSVDEHELSVVATDAAGNTSAPVTITITVEAPAPDLTVAILAPAAGATAEASTVISGTATAGAAISVEIDGMIAGTTVAAADGTWSLAVTLAEGAHTVSAVATLGEQTATAGPVAFTVAVAEPVDPNAGVSLGGDGASCATAPQGRAAPSLLWLGLVGLVGLLRRRRA